MNHSFIIQPSSHRAGVLFIIGIMITILFKFYNNYIIYLIYRIYIDGTIIIIAYNAIIII